MANMNNLSVVEVHIFEFIRKSFSISRSEIITAFQELKEKLTALETNSLDTRSFMYLDIISWLDSKIKKVPVEKIIREKYLIKTA